MTAAMTTKLASGGDDIKIWDSVPFVLAHRFSPYSSSIRSLHWSPDLLHVVSVPQNGEVVMASYTKNAEVSSVEVNTGVTHSYARCANTHPQIVAIGANNGTINVWNMKAQKSKSVFMKHKSEITCLQFNWNDSYIASGSVNGDLILHSMLTNQEHILHCAPRPDSVRDLQFSYVKKSLLGTVSENGTMSLWDINDTKLIHSFKQSHAAPATSLAFSPVNNLLVASVGLDKRLICYDPQVKSCIKTYRSEAPLTAVDFMDDGITLAVGSAKGKIYVYDLRSSSIPIKTLAAHNGSVQCLIFQHSAYSVLNKSGSASASKFSQLCKDKEAIHPVDSNINQDKILLRSNDVNANSSPKTVQEITPDNSHELTSTNSTANISSSSKLESIFSPLGSQNVSEFIGGIRRQPIGGGCQSAAVSNLINTNIQNSQHHLEDIIQNTPLKKFYSTPVSYGGIDNVKHPGVIGAWKEESDMCTSKSEDKFLSEQECEDGVKVLLPNNPSLDCYKQNDKTEVEVIDDDDECRMETDVMTNKESQETVTSTLKEHIKRTIQNTFKEQIQKIIQDTFKEQMQQEIHELLKKCVQQVVDDTVLDLHDTLHREHNQLQFEMIRQFQIQLLEIQELLKQTLLNEQQLIAEVERLKTENEKLKIIY